MTRKVEDAPLGSIRRQLLGKPIPEGWLRCDGRWLDVDKYPALYHLFQDSQVDFGFDQMRNRFRIPNMVVRNRHRHALVESIIRVEPNEEPIIVHIVRGLQNADS